MGKYIFEPEAIYTIGLFCVVIILLVSYCYRSFLEIKNGKKSKFAYIGLFLIFLILFLGNSFIQIEINNFRIVEIVESKYPKKDNNEILLLDEYSRFIKLNDLTNQDILSIKESNKIYEVKSFFRIRHEYRFKKISF